MTTRGSLAKFIEQLGQTKCQQTDPGQVDGGRESQSDKRPRVTPPSQSSGKILVLVCHGQPLNRVALRIKGSDASQCGQCPARHNHSKRSDIAVNLRMAVWFRRTRRGELVGVRSDIGTTARTARSTLQDRSGRHPKPPKPLPLGEVDPYAPSGRPRR